MNGSVTGGRRAVQAVCDSFNGFCHKHHPDPANMQRLRHNPLIFNEKIVAQFVINLSPRRGFACLAHACKAFPQGYPHFAWTTFRPIRTNPDGGFARVLEGMIASAGSPSSVHASSR
jgi:hypothetical protein